jgi:predicted Ser/Thr protein kinase
VTTKADVEMAEQDETKLARGTRVYIWRNQWRGEVAVVAKSEKAARQQIQLENPALAVMLQGDPLVIDPTVKDSVVFRWRRY